ncbi:MAG: hypothetical protein IJZ85_08700 [Lachnospiraceae bacterium]|nr:hypothetical protein [Lachnospiraceae bacterium]
MRDKIQILCYGDSNTWGTIGRWYESKEPSERYDPEHRWPCVLQAQLGDAAEVIAEGLGGRSTIYTREGEEYKSGESYLLPCLHSHYPLDLVIIMLGTNDLQIKKDITEAELPVGISRLVDIVQRDVGSGRKGEAPKVLIIAPAEVQPSSPEGRVLVYDKFRRETGRNLSLMFPEVYANVAKEKGCYFLNSQDYAVPGPADGVHFDAESHVRLGQAVAEFVRNCIFPER